MKNYSKIIDTLSQNKILYKIDESLSKHTSIKIGGKAKIFVEVKAEKELVFLLKYLSLIDTKYHILGNGTNTLACDDDFEEVVICTKALKWYKVSGDTSKNLFSIYIQSGMGLFELNKKLRTLGLGGLEFSYGIPGSVGGAVCMNAGAYGKCIGDFVEYVKIFDGEKVLKISRKNMLFSYRQSLVQNSNLVVLGVKLNLQKSDSKDIEFLQKQYFQKRLDSQPYDKLSFGSCFKRYEGKEPISKLIDDLGLKGYRIGDAEISEKHAGFIINIGSATCQDVRLLIKYIQGKIFEHYGFVPEPEVKFLGE